MAAVADGASSRLPYRHLNEAELELATIGSDAGASDPGDAAAGSGGHGSVSQRQGMVTLVLSCAVAAGVQFGWALQLSLLTPYIQTLGIQHAFSSFIWLCGPITGFVVQPCVGIWSDKCHSKYGRRRPFILAGCIMISAAVTLIGFSADIGFVFGDTSEDCSTYKGPRYRAAAVFIFGFWMLDLANNTVQGPARALLADLSGPDQRNSANAVFCSWMALGNILGFSSGASGKWHKWFPFLTTKACCEACGNLKAAFLVAVVFLLFCMMMTLYFAKEIPLEASHHASDSSPLLHGTNGNSADWSDQNGERLQNGHSHFINQPELADNTEDDLPEASSKSKEDDSAAYHDGPGAVLVNILTSLRHLPVGMNSVLLVMALTWLSWFPFFLFDTDWMGREVYHGDPQGDQGRRTAYDDGVREGAFGLLLNSVVLGVGSFLVDPMCRTVGARLVWAMSNFALCVCMAAVTILSFLSTQGFDHIIGANKNIKIATLVVFSFLGLPLSVTYSVPFSITADLTTGTGGGQGLATGVLNLAIVIPQMIVSLGAGPWDAIFGGGNVPAFTLASISSLLACIIAFLKLPRLSNAYSSAGFHGFG